MNVLSPLINDEVTYHLLNNIKEGLIVTEDNGNIIFCNEQLLSLLHYKEGDLLEHTINDVLAVDLKKIFKLGKLSPKNEILVSDIDLLGKHGESISCQLRLDRLKTADQKTHFLVYVNKVEEPLKINDRVFSKINAIENLTKSRTLREGHFENALIEILENASLALNVQRLNVWMYNTNIGYIHCICDYDAIHPSKKTEPVILYKKDFPKYFQLIQTEEIIICNDTFNDPQVQELFEEHLLPKGITSMMDVPIRVEGKMVGVVCFEHTGAKRNWDILNQKFGLFISQIISMAIETNEKRKIKVALEESLKKEKLLMKEMQHRVKNNLMIVSSLINLQGDKAKDAYHKELFRECRNRIISIASVHELLYKNETGNHSINFKNYIELIIKNIKQSFHQAKSQIEISSEIENHHLELTIAIPMGLIINELLTNSYKHAFKGKSKGSIRLVLKKENKAILLSIKDDGTGMDPEVLKGDTMGITLVKSLAEQINCDLEYKNKKGSEFMIRCLQEN